MNVNEYGVVFAFYVAYDLSANTALNIEFTKPDGTTITRAATAPNVPLVLTNPAVTYPANEYAEYVFVPDDVDQAGDWTARVIYEDGPGLKLISDIAPFTVAP